MQKASYEMKKDAQENYSEAVSYILQIHGISSSKRHQVQMTVLSVLITWKKIIFKKIPHQAVRLSAPKIATFQSV